MVCKIFSLLFIIISLSVISCRDDFEFENSTDNLDFSKQTVYLDTVFSNIGSSTYRLKVYNRSNKDIKIPKIQLGKTNTSKFRIMVDGMTGEDADNSGVGDGKIFNDVELLAKDSLFIFIEVTADVASANPIDFLYTDEIQFLHSNGTTQKVDLVTLVKDAIFIYPDRPISTGIKEKLIVEGLEDIEGHTLTSFSELNWTSTKPYVVYGYAAVPNGSTLTINDGTSVYFHANSGLVIDNQAKLIIDGHLNNTNPDGTILTKHEVTFEGDRLEPNFEDTPGQWGTIFLFSSLNNTINHLTLKNSIIGIYMQTNNTAGNSPNLEINNSQIYNSSNYGIYSFNSTIDGKNTVINNCGQACFAGIYGGDYKFTHCTFNNDWQSSKQFSVYLGNYVKEATPQTNPLTQALFTNCIIYGSNQVELFLEKQATGVFNYNFDHCLIKFNDSNTTLASNLLYDTIRLEQNGNIKNKDPKFKDKNKNQLNLLLNSPANSAGISTTVLTDILNNNRHNPPTIGAYEFMP